MKDVAITGLFTAYFKHIGKNIEYWKQMDLINGNSSRIKPLFKDECMSGIVSGLSLDVITSANQLCTINPIFGPIHAVRHRYFNKSLSRAIKRPLYTPKQVILLGSGMDTRPFRKAKYNVKYFDVDQPRVVALKNSYIGSSTLKNVSTISIDYLKEDLLDSLINNALDVNASTHIIWVRILTQSGQSI